MPLIILWHSIGINADADADVWNAFFPQYVNIGIGNDIKLNIGIGNCELCMPILMVSIICWHSIGINPHAGYVARILQYSTVVTANASCINYCNYNTHCSAQLRCLGETSPLGFSYL